MHDQSVSVHFLCVGLIDAKGELALIESRFVVERERNSNVNERSVEGRARFVLLVRVVRKFVLDFVKMIVFYLFMYVCILVFYGDFPFEVC